MIQKYAILGSVRITVEVEEGVLAEVMALTGERRKSPALAKAIIGFVRRQRAREFGRLIREGAFDYPTAPSPDAANPVPPLR